MGKGDIVEFVDYYDVLEISKTASDEVIKAAYKALVKRYHPDSMTAGDQSKTMAQINEAYETLSDAIRREKYDQQLKMAGVTHDTHTYQEPSRTAHEAETPNSNANSDSWALKFLKGLGKSIHESTVKWNAEMENAYIEGKKMTPRELIRMYKQAKGAERIGYQKVLEEKRMLCRNADGMYVPTDKFRFYERF
ncbi:MAG: DnaJ domain-containing protein [Lachnospiraceae bacterium]|nr:DnaJ domain-containing protein [Lachnospiraceae bacterium]